jgi:hypothetical protein
MVSISVLDLFFGLVQSVVGKVVICRFSFTTQFTVAAVAAGKG